MCSSGRSRGARLVTRSCVPGAPARSSASTGAASSTCSRLSRTSSVRRPRRWRTSASVARCREVSLRPSVEAIVGATRPGSTIGASSTNTVSRDRPSPVVASTASRVLPVPGGPVSVRSRTSARPSRARISRSSFSRPTKEVERAARLGVGRPAAPTADRPCERRAPDPGRGSPVRGVAARAPARSRAPRRASSSRPDRPPSASACLPER